MDGPLHRDCDTLAEACDRAARSLAARHGWELLPPEALARRALALAGQGRTPARAVVNCYSRALHAACSGAEGRDRQERGYLELYRYLLEAARWRLPDEAEELAQVALEMTYCGLGRCREPGAFLRFALFQLQDATRALRRERARPVESLARPVGPDGVTLGETLVDERHPDPAEIAARRDLRAGVAACAAQAARARPRAALQLRAVWLKYIAGLDDRTIAAQLGRPPGLVHVLRSRGLRLLREQKGLRALAADLGIAAARPMQESPPPTPFTSEAPAQLAQPGGPAPPRPPWSM